jgi:hypothetical protein
MYHLALIIIIMIIGLESVSASVDVIGDLALNIARS